MATLRKFVLGKDSLGRGEMLELDSDERVYVRLEDFERMDKRFQLELGAINERNADVNRREAAWMVKEKLLRDVLAERSHPDCGCLSCQLAKEITLVLNFAPDVGEGFQSVKGLDSSEVQGEIPAGRPMGTDVYIHDGRNDRCEVSYPKPGVYQLTYPASEPGFAQGVQSQINEALIQTGSAVGQIKHG